MTFVANLVFLVAVASNGWAVNDVVVMPFVGLPPLTWEECNSVGMSALQYAVDIADENGYNDIVLPDGSILISEPIYYSCTPSGWVDGTAQEVAL